MNSVFDGISAIILAGGISSRMNEFKPLLPLGDTTVIEKTAKVFLEAGITDILAVTGHCADELEPVLDAVGIRRTYNGNYREGMFSSVIAGVKALSSSTEGFFLMPADMPLVRPDTIRRLFSEFRENEPYVAYPVYKGTRGHPPLISVKLVPDILSWKGEGGLRALLSEYREKALNVEVGDEGILVDADTPGDYIKLCRLYDEL